MAFSAMPLRTANDPTCVRVAVRVRPLTSQEIGQGGKSVLKVTAPEIRLGERRFTYDAVFDDDVTQQDLYQQVSAPLLTSFVDGYNATIMAYGQTGSGKTFTMGSEAHTELEVGINTGLIPRFMHGLFTSLQSKKDASDLEHSNNSLIDYHLQASFLEVYGEDVHDLLDPRRHSLPLREDSSGAIVCNGLTHRGVQTAQEVLNVLHEGTLNRTTAATLMNLTSSRSHAVFTVTLAQKYCRDGVDVSVSSRFTFVDLAGSERMKKTGAQGERAREGIKINEGLLALGNVINALAENKKAHVPYRQSKLTRLLQDALGGNSQTLFLACVSPSDTNASETLSTMHYANRARNIQNAPVQNIDAGLLELQRYKALTHVLQAELVKRAFGVLNENSNVGEVEDVLLERPDVVEYLQHLQAVAQEKQASVCVTVSPSTAATMQMTSPRAKGKTVSIVQYSSPQPNIAPGGSDSDKSVLEQFDSAFLDEVNPDEEMAILDQLLELQQRDHEFGKEKQKDDAELKQMEGELAEQQTMLLQLRESLRVYHDMKIKYEALMAEVGQLEAEKAQLAEQLDKAAADPSKGCSKAIKKELEMVEQSLARARNETRKHRQLYRKAEQEAQRCKVMERKISELKHGRANLIKKQKEAATRHREYTEARTREIATLKRKERNAEKRVGKLQTEVSVHKRNLDKRQTYITKLSTKLKQTESHLMKLLSLRNRELRDRTSATPQYRLSLCPSGRRSSVVVKKSGGEHEFASLNDEVISLKFLIEKLVSERVGKVEIQAEYEQKVAEYSLTMRSMVEAVKDLEESRNSRSERLSNDTEEMVQEHEHAVGELELKVELLGSDLENLQTHLDTFEDGDETKSGSEVKNLVANQSAPVLRTLLVEICETLTEAEIERKKTTNAVSRKDSALRCLENEVDALNSRLFVFTRELADQRRTSDSQTDPLETLATIQAQNLSLTNQIEDLVRERSFLTTQTADLLKRLQVVDLDCFDAKERLAMMEVALEQVDGVAMPDQVLTKMQSLWRELGVSIDSRACVHTEIENCLADTCSRKLREVSELKATTEADILKLEQELLSMQASLGITPSVDTKLAESSLVEKLRSLRQKHAEIRPSYANAVKRREHFAKQASDLCSAMEINVQDLPAELHDIITKTSIPESDLASCQLNENFLDQCNKEITALRVKKSERLVKNSEIHKKCFVLCREMNLIDSDVVSLVTQSARHRLKSLPGWWTSDAINCVSRAVVADAGVIRTTSSFTNHLNMVHEALEKISKSRRALSDRLRDIIERTQKTLLETVEGEVEAIDAYASFHEALFRLPALSKECIQACITEVKALVPGVEAMTQSEIEALTVVWEALSVSSGDRGNFWSRIEENSTEMQALVLRPFDELLTLSACDGEQWILSAVKDVTNQFVELETRLFKLQSIHGEVEKLRAKQEAKSSIISLDSEIRILSAELAEFEDSQCNKQRLLSKKSGSSNLLKEERFRKQMQGKFAAKLEQLSSLLKAWLSDEGTNFHSNLLSYEVSSLLQSSEHMDTWVEQRTEFMHLRTVQAKSAMKRPKSAQGEDRFSPVSRKRSARSQLPQPGESVLKKPKTSVTDTAQPRRPATFARGSKRKPSPENVVPTQARLTKASRTTRTASSSSSSSRSASPSPGKDMAKVKNIHRQPLSPKRVQRQTDSKATKANSKRLTLPPFGHVLEQASTPRNMSKENSTDID